MKFRIERDVFAEAVAWTARSLPNRPSVPVLAGLMIEADAEGLSLSGFDYETSTQATLTADVADGSWRLYARCAETDPEAFFPGKGESSRSAKRVCAGCTVRAECLEYALTYDVRFGIWGGVSERERRRMRRRRPLPISA